MGHLCPTGPWLASTASPEAGLGDALNAACRRDPAAKSLTPVLVVRVHDGRPVEFPLLLTQELGRCQRCKGGLRQVAVRSSVHEQCALSPTTKERQSDWVVGARLAAAPVGFSSLVRKLLKYCDISEGCGSHTLGSNPSLSAI